MSRLPDLERELLQTAERLDAHEAASAPNRGADRRQDRRWRRGGVPLLAGLAGLLVAGGAIAGVSGLLADGAPVPKGPTTGQLRPVPGTTGFALTDLRVPDPEGGPDWGIGTYTAAPGAVPENLPAGLADQFRRSATCVVVGRVQAGQLGVVGRDGVFGDDGRFHRLSPASQASGTCAGRGKSGSFVVFGYGPPIPASGYTGPAGTAIGGCRERVNLDGPTVSPQTRRRLRNVPECAVSGLRRVISGFAGPHAVTATLIDEGHRTTIKLEPRQNGAYLFVIRSAAGGPVRLAISDAGHHVCRPFERPGRPGGTVTRPPAGVLACDALAGR